MKIILISFLSIILIGILLNWFYPFKKIELVVMFKLYSKGSGLDDGVQNIILSSKEKYGNIIKDVLLEERFGSCAEMAAVTFSEMVIDEPGVREALTIVRDTHTDKGVSDLIAAILESTVKRTLMSSDDSVSAYHIELIEDNANKK
ncbi:hypothetical protein [Shewanella khirikhana]|uniref:Uncharacterized protein n=1 Tax=Shewanella khirikhana TaxID=1965282 RepID=A0ABM7DQB0_9GAMM|nr:hypothetical protein [Shewanella khirikhana]AZQ11873.1 hypothetical protein STH12_02804 [Shewanella khirikhana]